jgi:hypothetical protein
MDKILNPALLGNWENWLRIFLMVAIGFVAVHFSQRLIDSKKG